MSNETLQVAQFCSQLRYSDLPGQVVERTKELVLDLLGNAIAGHEMESSRLVTGLVRSMGGTEEATVIGEGLKVPVANAVLANGSMAHGVEMGDTHRWTYLHPGAAVIPTALAIAEKHHLSGDELLVAVVAGYEVGIRLAYAVNPSHRRRGFHTTATVGAVAATAAASRAMSLGLEETANALGIGGTQAAGLVEFLAQGAMIERFHPGRSAQSGIYAALLASAGFTGPETILEGPHGFCRAMSDEPDLGWLNRGLGEEFRILEVGTKPYASCRFCNSSIDAAREIVAETGPLPPDMVAEIVVTVSPLCSSQTGNQEPKSFIAAQLSTPYSVALTISGKGAGLSGYMAGLGDKAVMATAKKVLLVADPSFGEDSRHVSMEVRLADGRRLCSTVDLPLGEPERPMTRDALLEKFMELATTAIDRYAAERIAIEIDGIERVRSLDGLLSLLGQPIQ